MTRKYILILLASSSLLLNGCSSVTQLLGDKASRPIPLNPLKPFKTSVNIKTDWQVNTNSTMGGNKIHPYIASNTIFVSGGRFASAWDKSSGKLIWRVDIGEKISAGVNGALAHKNGQQVFIGTTTGNAISLDAKTGKIQWVERLSSEILAVSPSKNGRVAFRSVDGKLHGLLATSGELIWQNSQPSPALTLQGASVPIIIGSLIISGFDNGKLVAYRLDNGQEVWKVAIAEVRGNTELERIIDIDGKIMSLGNALFSSSLHGKMTGLNLENGKLVWSKSFSSSTGVNANPLGLYSSDDKGNIWKLDPQTGVAVWKMDDLQRYKPTLPALAGSSLLAVADKKGNIHWISTTTGLFVARSQGDPAGYSVEPKVNGNSIYAIGKSGVLSKLTWQ